MGGFLSLSDGKAVAKKYVHIVLQMLEKSEFSNPRSLCILTVDNSMYCY